MFDLNEPKDLYRIILGTLDEYSRNPTEKDFLFLTLGLTHLREWISESGQREIRAKQERGEGLTDGERFFADIYEIPSFRVVQGLCNRGKHHITVGNLAVTEKVEGLRAGFGRAGDSLGQTYFMIDGQDSREYFAELIRKYNEWFDGSDIA